MPTVFPTPTSPPPNQETMSTKAPSPPPPSRMSARSSSSNLAAAAANASASNAPTSQHQVGTRQATRSRTRTRQVQNGTNNGTSSTAGPSRNPLQRYNSEDHPLSTHKLAAKGYHQFHCLGVPFHVKKRYTFLRELGIGAYGCVALAHDSVLDCNVAIKKVTRIFEREVLARRALREVAVLREIGLCDNVTALLDFDTTFMEFNEIYLVLEASEADLSQIIRSGQALSDAHLQYFIAQILRGVRYMHAAKIIHRDMKPGNLLVNGDCQLKLCDFGLARAYRDHSSTPPTTDTDSPSAGERMFPESPHGDKSHPCSPSLNMTEQNPSQIRTTALDFPGGPLTEYVATRWYRAPEIMLCFKRGYGPAIDMWSVGCILAELLGGKPIFAGKDYVDQIARINNVLGSPPESTIEKIGSERARTYVESLPHMPKVPFSQLYPKANPLAVDLLDKMICWDPEERISASEALQHPWLKAYHRSNGNWAPPRPFDRFDEVEMLASIADFRVGLEREADEMRAELEVLEAEELQAAVAAAEAASSNLDPEADDQDDTLVQPVSSDEHVQSELANGASRSSAPSRSVASSGGSALVTPSSLSPSMNEISPTYETDLTSVSAPHSIAGSHSAGKRSKSLRSIDGLGLSSNNLNGGKLDRFGNLRQGSWEALDKSLASHGLLCGDESELIRNAVRSKSTFRRRAVSNAPSQIARLRRRGSEGSLRQLVKDASTRSACGYDPTSSGTAPGTVVDAGECESSRTIGAGGGGSGHIDDGEGSLQGSEEGEESDGAATSIQHALHNPTKTTDLIRRSTLQREEHEHVADDVSGLLTWLSLSSFSWSGRKRWWSGTSIDHPEGGQ